MSLTVRSGAILSRAEPAHRSRRPKRNKFAGLPPAPQKAGICRQAARSVYAIRQHSVTKKQGEASRLGRSRSKRNPALRSSKSVPRAAVVSSRPLCGGAPFCGRRSRGTCKIWNIAGRPHRPILQVQQNTVPNFRESAVSAANGEFCKSLSRAAWGQAPPPCWVRRLQSLARPEPIPPACVFTRSNPACK